MDRELVSEARLVEIINGRLAATETASHCRYSGVYTLQEPDEKGCNWSAGYFSAGDDPRNLCGPVVARVVREMRAKYNLEEESA